MFWKTVLRYQYKLVIITAACHTISSYFRHNIETKTKFAEQQSSKRSLPMSYMYYTLFYKRHNGVYMNIHLYYRYPIKVNHVSYHGNVTIKRNWTNFKRKNLNNIRFWWQHNLIWYVIQPHIHTNFRLKQFLPSLFSKLFSLEKLRKSCSIQKHTYVWVKRMTYHELCGSI